MGVPVRFGGGGAYRRAGYCVLVACSGVPHQCLDAIVVLGGVGPELEIAGYGSDFDGHYATGRAGEWRGEACLGVLCGSAQEDSHPCSMSWSVAFSWVFMVSFHWCLIEIQRLAYSQR